ncbi:MAG: ketoacyl-ACP synthase III [Bacteroidetes bacterium]|jgi:3-oxoacyl-[acyl-carrier-protein] synthase-3|nr:ketoacyl-ACP synthase III [Bacteroidota bacterium]
MQKITAAITAVGGYVPETVLTNKDLEKLVDTSDEWITTRTGIKERHILREPGKATSDMAVRAIIPMLEKRGISPEELDVILVGTITGDYIFPACANIIADKIGAKNAWGFDIAAACSGFLYALETGSRFVQSGSKKVLVCGFDKMSTIIDYTDRNTCIIFGDGGGCVLLEPNTDGYGVRDSILKMDGSGREFLFQPAGGSMNPPTLETVSNRQHYVYQEGKTVFKFAVTNMADVSYDIMDRNGLNADSVDWLIAHQANLRIIDATAERMGLDKEKVLVNIDRYGNTTAGTLPLLMYDFEKKFKKGDNLILSTFGGGFTWGSIYIKWAYNPA